MRRLGCDKNESTITFCLCAIQIPSLSPHRNAVARKRKFVVNDIVTIISGRLQQQQRWKKGRLEEMDRLLFGKYLVHSLSQSLSVSSLSHFTLSHHTRRRPARRSRDFRLEWQKNGPVFASNAVQTTPYVEVEVEKNVDLFSFSTILRGHVRISDIFQSVDISARQILLYASLWSVRRTKLHKNIELAVKELVYH